VELKEYQKEVLTKVKDYIEWLKKAKAEAERRNASIDSVFEDYFDFSQAAWKKVNPGPYKSKKNGLNQDLPNFYLKIPTGGGKTLLACHVIDIINRIYLEKQTGVVLWIVPTNQIYRQTLNHLRDRNDPYRQVLDIASGGRTMVLEKTERFTPQDVTENLVILMLMLPSANRMDREVLKVFRDNGGFSDFFPPEDDFQANHNLLKIITNLDCFPENYGLFGRIPKTSLGNTLKILQPIIILDEGHKAYSPIAQETLRGFNPCIIVALSATPPQGENILLNISGQQLNREEMIKLDLHVINKATTDWRNIVLFTLEKRNFLEEKAKEYQANTGEYIRPIALIQVERTGKEQRKGIFIHADDVKEFLSGRCGVPEDQIAIKSSSKDDIEGVDLLVEDCPIRYIITKQALQEGWDCPFAYTLTVLTNPESRLSMTQLVGRILRQPRARKTKIKDLDESYVFCFRPRAEDLLQQIKRGFEEEGLGDLSGRMTIETESGEVEEGTIQYHYRDRLRKFEGKIYLPRFIIQEENHWREINYEMDIERRISWDSVDLDPLFESCLASGTVRDKYITIKLSPQPEELIKAMISQSRKGHLEVDPVFFTRQLLDIVKNPWLAYDLSKKIINGFLARHQKSVVDNNFLFIIQESKRHLENERDRLAEAVFKDLIDHKKICFFLLSSPEGRYSLFSTINIRKNSKALVHHDHTPIQKSLLEFNPEEEFNEYEKRVALYLDKQEKLLWWFRNLSGQDYYLQGWKKNKVYPDFIVSRKDDQNPEDYKNIFVIETKGEHLLGSLDTTYKENIFELCNQLGEERSWDDLEQEFSNKRVEFQLIPEGEWESHINRMFSL